MATAKDKRYVRDDSHLYRTEIPNILLDPDHPTFGDLTLWDLGLYLVYKRTASDSGACWKSRRTLASEARMSAAKVVTCHRTLVAAGLVVDRWDPDNERNETVIVDIWLVNLQWYGDRRSQGEHGVQGVNGGVQGVNGGVHDMNERITPEEKTNKNPGNGQKPTGPPGTRQITPGLHVRY